MSCLNLCCACRTDFASVAAFDRLRIGVREFTFAEGLEFDIPREDGRRCIYPEEMLEAGMELDSRGRWRIISDVGRRLRRAA